MNISKERKKKTTKTQLLFSATVYIPNFVYYRNIHSQISSNRWTLRCLVMFKLPDCKQCTPRELSGTAEKNNLPIIMLYVSYISAIISCQYPFSCTLHWSCQEDRIQKLSAHLFQNHRISEDLKERPIILLYDILFESHDIYIYIYLNHLCLRSFINFYCSLYIVFDGSRSSITEPVQISVLLFEFDLWYRFFGFCRLLQVWVTTFVCHYYEASITKHKKC